MSKSLLLNCELAADREKRRHFISPSDFFKSHRRSLRSSLKIIKYLLINVRIVRCNGQWWSMKTVWFWQLAHLTLCTELLWDNYAHTHMWENYFLCTSVSDGYPIPYPIIFSNTRTRSDIFVVKIYKYCIFVAKYCKCTLFEILVRFSAVPKRLSASATLDHYDINQSTKNMFDLIH